MLKIAITGNIAAGKSEVEKILIENGFKVYDTDKIAHKILGDVDRRALGEKIFSDKNAKKELEDYIHPKIKQELQEIFKQKNEKVIFVSVPLLFETDFYLLFDKILFIEADDSIRLKRLMQRNNFSEEEALKRMHAQLPQKEKIKKSDFIISNNSTKNELEKEVLVFIGKLHSLI